MFDRVDLESYGVVPADVQSTFLNEERVEMFSFFHLTVQEHLDALYCATNLFSQNRHNPSSGLLVLQSTDLNMDKLENLQMFTRFFMGVLRARLAGQLDGLVISPREQRDSIAARLGVWFRDQIKGRKLENPAQPWIFSTAWWSFTWRKPPALQRQRSRNFEGTEFSSFWDFKIYRYPNWSGSRPLIGVIRHDTKCILLQVNSSIHVYSMCGNNLGPDGVLELWNALDSNSTVEELYLDITGITEERKTSSTASAKTPHRRHWH